MKTWWHATNNASCRQKVRNRLKKSIQKKLKRSLLAYLLILPALIIALLFIYFPSAYVINLSFFDWDMIQPTKTFVGLGNFTRLFAPKSDFWQSLARTLEYSAIYIPMSLVSGLVLALGLTKIKALKGFFQSVFFIPSITSISVISIVWSYLFNPQIGPINQFLEKIGLAEKFIPQWLNDPNLALPVLAVIGVWQSMGFVTLLFIGGLNNIPSILQEAAQVDGATSWKTFWKVTLPLLSPVTYFLVFMLLIDSFRVFGIVAIMTQGKPIGSTNILLYYVYRNAFQYFDAGKASAASWIIFMIIMIFFLLQRKLGERNVFYQ
jgi:multiple sugar transport system permease protein